jgi:transcriptional regulator with XRE-family HTH domain
MNAVTDLIKRHGRSRVARALGVTPPATYPWEEGKLSAERAMQIAAVFDVPKWRLRPDLWAPPNKVQDAA